MFLGRIAGKVRPNDSEIDAIRYLDRQRLDEEMASRPATFTPWFKQEWETLKDRYGDQLARYAM